MKTKQYVRNTAAYGRDPAGRSTFIRYQLLKMEDSLGLHRRCDVCGEVATELCIDFKYRMVIEERNGSIHWESVSEKLGHVTCLIGFRKVDNYEIELDDQVSEENHADV